MATAVIALARLLPLAAPALAAEGHEAAATFLGQPLWIWQLINLVVFLGLLVWLLKKPVGAFFGDRRREVEETLRKAEENRKRAEELVVQIEGRLAKLDLDLAAIHEHAKTEAAAEQDDLLRQAEDESKKIVERARAEMETRVRHARKELTTFAGDLSVEIARDLLAKNVSHEDEDRLLREGLTSLAAAAAKPGPRSR